MKEQLLEWLRYLIKICPNFYICRIYIHLYIYKYSELSFVRIFIFRQTIYHNFHLAHFLFNLISIFPNRQLLQMVIRKNMKEDN